MLRLTLAGLIVALLAAHATAEPPAYKAVVTDAEVKLRAGPSDQYPETGALRAGEEVTVEREAENGWLAVTAPKGSVSWIACTFVEDIAADRPAPRKGFVNYEGDVTLAAGQAGLPQPLNIRREKVPQGTAVLIIGPVAQYDGKRWLPIEPPAGDVRYIPKTAVKFDKPANNNFTVRVNESSAPLPPGAAAAPAGGTFTASPGPNITPVSGGVTASKPAVNHPLWVQAEAAERDNRLVDAEKLYFQLAEEMNRANGDHDVANMCYSRIHAIREKQRGTRGTGAPSALPNTLKPLAKDERVVRDERPVRDERVAKDERGVKAGTPEPLPSAAPVGEKDERAEWHTGKLVFSTSTPDGPNRQVYLLEASGGNVKMYVTAAEGVDLRRYLGQRVNVLGAPTTRTGLTRPYLVATDVKLAQ